MKVLNNVEIGVNYSKPKRGNDNNSHLIKFRQNDVKKVEYLQNKMEEVRNSNKNSANSENVSKAKEYSTKLIKLEREVQDNSKDDLINRDFKKVDQKNRKNKSSNIKNLEKEFRNINFKNAIKLKVEKQVNGLESKQVYDNQNINLRNFVSGDGDIFVISEEARKKI